MIVFSLDKKTRAFIVEEIKYFVALSSNRATEAILNDRFIKSNNVSKENVNLILLNHDKKYVLFSSAADLLKNILSDDYINSQSYTQFERIASEMEAMEYNTQTLWGFDQLRAKHTWWLQTPGCSCSYSENNFQRGIRIEKSTCFLHGENPYKNTKEKHGTNYTD